MRDGRFHLVIPGSLDQRTGGYLYSARIRRELENGGWTVPVHSLDGAFPDPDSTARRAMEEALAAIPSGERVVLDGLAMGGLPDPVQDASDRLRLVSLVHHPLADETGLSDDGRRRFQELEMEALRSVEGVVVTSSFTASRLQDYGVDPSRIRVVEPGTDRPVREEDGEDDKSCRADRVPESSGATGSEAGPASEASQALRLLTVGSVIPRKGHEVLIEALSGLTSLPWSLTCAGSLERAPAYVRLLRKQVAESGLEHRVTFAGELAEHELGALYRSSSVFVLASHYEGYGMALTEALVRGLPVVATTGGAIPFTVPEEGGLLVPPGDVVALRGALRKLLGHDHGARDLRRRLARGAVRHAAGLPSWTEAALAFADVVMDLTSEPTGEV